MDTAILHLGFLIAGSPAKRNATTSMKHCSLFVMERSGTEPPWGSLV
jgi:hypothetical protein